METKSELAGKHFQNLIVGSEAEVLVETTLYMCHQATFALILLLSLFHYKTELISCTAENNIAFESYRVQPQQCVVLSSKSAALPLQPLP